MQAQNFKQKFKQTVQTFVASDLPGLYGSLLLRTSSVVTCLALVTAYPLVVQAAAIGEWKIDPNTGIALVPLVPPPGNE